MKILVMKFGGTSVATPEARALSASRVISAREAGHSPVVVVSAIGRKGAPYATDTLLSVLHEVDPHTSPNRRETDLLMACGEILSSVIFTQVLKSMGYPAVAVTGQQAGIFTDPEYGNARIRRIEPSNLLRWLGQGLVPVVCGFQGTIEPGAEVGPGEVTTLGRGGSDTTASALGAALQAVAVEIYTDVDGVKTADPDYVPDAPTLRKVTYEEVAEIAHLGAKVLHPRAAEIAMRYSIPLFVKSSFSDAPGTEIVPLDKLPGRRITGVTHSGKLVFLSFDFSPAPAAHRRELASRIYHAMAVNGVNLHMLNLSPDGTGFAVPRTQYPMVESLLNGLVVPVGEERAIYLMQIGQVETKAVQTQAALLERFGPVVRIRADVTESCTMVSVIGHEYLQQPGVFHRAIRVLAENQIAVLQTSDSELSMSLLILESETRRAVSLLHDAFGLQEAT